MWLRDAANGQKFRSVAKCPKVQSCDCGGASLKTSELGYKYLFLEGVSVVTSNGCLTTVSKLRLPILSQQNYNVSLGTMHREGQVMIIWYKILEEEQSSENRKESKSLKLTTFLKDGLFVLSKPHCPCSPVPLFHLALRTSLGTRYAISNEMPDCLSNHMQIPTCMGL